MNCIFMPSLEHIALVKISTILWIQEDISLNCKTKWHKIENQIRKKVLILPLPEPLKDKILGTIKPIGLQIFGWMKYNKNGCKIAINLTSELIWTPHGVLDRKKTAEALMKDESIDITKRYRLAHIYCLENDVETLRGKMSENQLRSFYKDEKPKMDVRRDVLLFWLWHTETFSDELSQYQSALSKAAVFDDRVPTEYFWNKLTPEQRVESLNRILSYFLSHGWKCDLWRLDVLHSLLSRATAEEQIKIIKKCPLKVLFCFLEWPWQSLFMKVTNHVCEFLDDVSYYQILDKIIRKVKEGYEDFDYQKLFEEFWRKSDTSRKKFVINQCPTEWLLLGLLEIKDMKNVLLILKDATVEEKENIFYKDVDICIVLARSNEWDSIRLLIKEFMPSREKMIEFKDKCEKNITWYDDKIQKFFSLLNDLIEQLSEEGEIKKNKKFKAMEIS